jgi:putative glutathione S-transferase
VNNKKTLREVYELGHPGYSGRATTPALFDTKTQTVVNNESSEILRMLNFEFNEFAKNPTLNLYPEQLRSSIDEVNSWVYPYINDGVYRCGFATDQESCKYTFQCSNC